MQVAGHRYSPTCASSLNNHRIRPLCPPSMPHQHTNNGNAKVATHCTPLSREVTNLLLRYMVFLIVCTSAPGLAAPTSIMARAHIQPERSSFGMGPLSAAMSSRHLSNRTESLLMYPHVFTANGTNRTAASSETLLLSLTCVDVLCPHSPPSTWLGILTSIRR